jgi:hypothetical protein
MPKCYITNNCISESYNEIETTDSMSTFYNNKKSAILRKYIIAKDW